jgi:metallo-beta-lactamase family protein
MLKVHYSGADQTVTGSCHYFEYQHDGSPDIFRFVVDCGMYQDGGDSSHQLILNKQLYFNPSEVDTILLTHAHLDHCGRIPLMYKKGFRGSIHGTKVTCELASIVMTDAARQQSHPHGHPDANIESFDPLYGEQDVVDTLKLLEPTQYHTPFNIHPNLRVEYFDAGHILGSSWITVTEISSGNTIVFSGDLGNINRPYVSDPELGKHKEGTKTIFCETTYGDRLHSPLKPEDEIERVLNETFARGGLVLVPAFAIQRTQEVIWYITKLQKANRIKKTKIYLDSPMAMEATQVFLNNTSYFDSNTLGADGSNPLKDAHLNIIQDRFESIELNMVNDAAVIIAGAGMMNGGRILKHVKFHAGDPKNTLLFVGFQSPGTIGRTILDGAKSIPVDGEMVTLNCHIDRIESFSGHGDQGLLLDWIDSHVNKGSSTQIRLVHGELTSMQTFKSKLEQQHESAVEVSIPELGKEETLWS